MRLSILPPILENELLSFYLERVLALHSRLTKRAVVSCIFGQPWREPAVQLPKNINDAVRCFGDSLASESPEEWLAAHTLFPFYTAFLNEDAQRCLLVRMLHGGYGPAHHSGGRLLPRRRFVRVCEECATADLAMFGFYRIHRTHMIPYVSCCVHHHCSLIEAATCDYCAIPSSSSGAQVNPHSATELVAGVSSELLLRAPRIEGRSELQQETFSNLKSLGFATVTGRLSMRRLVPSLREYYANILLSTTLRETLDSASLPAYLRSTLPSQKNVNPAAYLLLKAFLYECRDDVSGQVSARTVSNSFKLERPTEAQVYQVLLASKTLTEAAISLNLAVTTLSTLARQYRFDYTFRPKHVVENIRHDVLKLLFGGASPSQVAEQHHLSISTIYRIRRTEPELVRALLARELELLKVKNRGMFARLMLSHLGLSSTVLRNQNKALWSWLYRNDREWLSANSPPKSANRNRLITPMWPHLERLVLPIIEEAIRFMVVKNRERITHTALFRIAGMRKIAKRNLVEMPLLKAMVESAVEDQASYVQRRLATAAHELGATYITPFSAIVKAARLRPTTVQLAGVDADTWSKSFSGKGKS